MTVIQEYNPGLREATAEALATAFVTNPLHVAAFGAGRVEQNRLFFRIGLEHMFSGPAFVAVIDRQTADVLTAWLERRNQLGLNGHKPIFCTLAGKPVSSAQIACKTSKGRARCWRMIC